MSSFEASVRRITILFMCAMMLLAVPQRLISICKGCPAEGPVADSILQQQRDSILFSLNLEYLNGVNDRKTPFELISIIEEILEIDPDQYNHWFNLGIENIKIHKYSPAIEALNRGLELYPTGDNPTLVQIYVSLSFCYHKIEKHKKEREILDVLSINYPDNPGIIGRYTVCAHSRMRYKEADFHKKHLISILRSRHLNESDISFYLGRLYLNTDYLEAEKHFRIALKYDPDSVEKQAALAWVLIRNALKIEKGMALIEQAILSDPDNAIYIHQQGYGFYVMGNYENAIFNLYNARELYQQYSFELNNHILMVEEALASQEE